MKFVKAEQVERGKLVITKREFDKGIKEILEEIHPANCFVISKDPFLYWEWICKRIIQKSGFDLK